MFGKEMKLMSLYGFNIKIDASWIFLLFLVVWTLSAGYFPYMVEGLNPLSYLWMGLLGAVGLFASLIFHELSHAIVARKWGLPIRGITLFIFGGVAEMESEPKTAKIEFWMAIAGPIASVVLGVMFLGLEHMGAVFQWPLLITAVVGYLWKINFILAAFNMLPGFPLDGGRILRSILWAWKKDIRWATHQAVRSGSFIGTVLIILGILGFLTGNFIGGLWWFLIALFLKGAAKSSEYSLLLREYLKGEPISQYMNSAVITIEPRVSVEDAVTNYFYKFHHRNFPVVDGERLLGVVSLDDIKKIPKDQWNQTSIQQIYTKASEANTVSPKEDSLDVLQKMRSEGRDTFMVSDDHLNGIISIKDLFRYLSLKLDLEERQSARLYRF